MLRDPSSGHGPRRSSGRMRRRAAWAFGALFLTACGSRAGTLTLPAGHPADPASRSSHISAQANAAAPREATSAPPDARPDEPSSYTCPMHSEITSAMPGKCPKCGMVLRKNAPASTEPAHGAQR